MRVYTREIDGKTIKAYNDSGCDWVVYSRGVSLQRFDMRKFTCNACGAELKEKCF